jgi:hypothetical protein
MEASEFTEKKKQKECLATDEHRFTQMKDGEKNGIPRCILSVSICAPSVARFFSSLAAG